MKIATKKGGIFYAKKNERGKQNIETKNKAKAVYQIDVETNKIVAKYTSINQASKVLGKASCRASIRLVCEGLQNTAYGFKWKYAN